MDTDKQPQRGPLKGDPGPMEKERRRHPAHPPHPPCLVVGKDRPPRAARKGLEISSGLVFRPETGSIDGTRAVLVGVLRNEGRATPAVAQYVRLREDAQLDLLGPVRDHSPGREMRVVFECESWEKWLRKLAARPNPRDLLKGVSRVADVPPELKRRLHD